VLEACADTRILTGRPHTSILVEAADLARACLERIQHPACPAEADCAWSFARALRAIIRPYLGEGYPSIDQMAEIVGLSPRTLQRRLQDCGRKYSDLVAEARIETARELMADSSLRITDIALAVGYDNPQHLSRLFRRITGLTPRAYRQAIVA
jgi:AraC-like DNA-binding protein